MNSDEDDVKKLNRLIMKRSQEGKTDEAILNSKKVLEIFEKKYSKNHPDVARSLSNLAGLYEPEYRHL